MKLKLENIRNEYIEVPFWDFALKVYLANLSVQLVVGSIIFIVAFIFGRFLVWKINIV